jgi:hypothetical protein
VCNCPHSVKLSVLRSTVFHTLANKDNISSFNLCTLVQWTVRITTLKSLQIWPYVTLYVSLPHWPEGILSNPRDVVFSYVSFILFFRLFDNISRSHWPHGLRRSSAASRLLRLWVRIPPKVECLLWVLCVVRYRILCDELITRPEEPYPLYVVYDLDTWWMGKPWPTDGCWAINKKN